MGLKKMRISVAPWGTPKGKLVVIGTAWPSTRCLHLLMDVGDCKLRVPGLLHVAGFVCCQFWAQVAGDLFAGLKGVPQILCSICEQNQDAGMDTEWMSSPLPGYKQIRIWDQSLLKQAPKIFKTDYFAVK